MLLSALLIGNALFAKSKSNNDFVELISSAGYSKDAVSFVLRDADSDSLLISINGNSLYNPASVMKLITAAAAFDILSPQYQFKTEVYTDSLFTRKSGVATDLYIRGGGDPGFTAERLWLFVMHLKHQGVREITDRLVIDASYFDTVTVGPGFAPDGSTRAYEAPISSLSANFNTVAIHVAPGESVGDPIHITPFPEFSHVKIISTAKTVKAKSSTAVTVVTEKIDDETAIAVYGSMAVGERTRYRYRKIYETDKYFGWVIIDLLKKNGIKFSGQLVSGTTPKNILSKKPLFIFKSEPLEKVVHSMFKYSSNFAAEMVFKSLGAEKMGSAGSWKKGQDVIRLWWKDRSIFSVVPKVSNGSGMGGGNRVSGNQVTALLSFVLKQKEYSPEYIRALSIAGVDGTVQQRFKKSKVKGIARCKTGTLNSRGVSNLAGYIFLPNKTLIFSVLVNDKKQNLLTHWKIQQRLVEKSALLFR